MWRIQAFDREGRQVATLDVAGGEVTVGREADRQLQLASRSVSRRHAKLVLDGPQPFIVDEGSANGVLVNGVRISGPTAIGPGTRVDIAEFRLELGLPPPTQAVAPLAGPGGGRSSVPAGPAPLRLAAEDGPFAGQSFELRNRVISLGRAIDNDLVFDDPSLSRKHGRLRNNGDHLEIEDLGSSNGTYVNGVRVQGAMIARPGDLLRFGELHFRLDGESLQAPAQDEDLVPARAGVPPAIVYGVVGVLVLVIGVLAAMLLLRSPKSGPAGDPMAQMTAQAALHLKIGKERLDAKDFVGAQKEFDQVLEVDPANTEARRLRAVALSEPQNEQLSKQARAKITIGTSRADFEAAAKLYSQIPQESVFRDPTAQRLAARLVTFGTGQCKARNYADCAWALCRAREVAPAADRASLVPADADSELREAEKKLAKDRAYTPCRQR